MLRFDLLVMGLQEPREDAALTKIKRHEAVKQLAKDQGRQDKSAPVETTDISLADLLDFGRLSQILEDSAVPSGLPQQSSTSRAMYWLRHAGSASVPISTGLTS